MHKLSPTGHYLTNKGMPLSFPLPLPQAKLSLGCQPVILPNPGHENDGIGLDLPAPVFAYG